MSAQPVQHIAAVPAAAVVAEAAFFAAATVVTHASACKSMTAIAYAVITTLAYKPVYLI